MTWTATLKETTRTLLPQLERRHCRLVWRADTMTDTSNEPFPEGTCWLEIWLYGTLLTFAGPLSCPVSNDTVESVAGPLIEQAALLLRLNPYSTHRQRIAAFTRRAEASGRTPQAPPA